MQYNPATTRQQIVRDTFALKHDVVKQGNQRTTLEVFSREQEERYGAIPLILGQNQ